MRHRCTGFTSPDRSPAAPAGFARAEREVVRPLLLTVREAAALMGVGRTTLYKLMATGELRSVQVGSSRRIPSAAVYEFVDRLSGQSALNEETGR
jgi:excisionase family DNA binding protein